MHMVRSNSLVLLLPSLHALRVHTIELDRLVELENLVWRSNLGKSTEDLGLAWEEPDGGGVAILDPNGQLSIGSGEEVVVEQAR